MPADFGALVRQARKRAEQEAKRRRKRRTLRCPANEGGAVRSTDVVRR